MLQIGRRIGDFIVERELGRGGMGIVYSAVHEQTAERVAIKVLSPHLLPDPRQRRRFQREAYAAAQVQHAGLVRVLSHGELEQAEPYIMMEYLDGVSLRQSLQAADGNRFAVEAAVQVAIQLADVLDSAHRSGLLHRDIKPSNVMMLGPLHEPERCRVKLLDFGLVRLLTEGEGATLSEGDVIGTPAYMSPEQCEGRADLDGRSDVYGLGALLFEMLCGRTPFIGPPPRMMYQHVYESVPAPERYRPELGAELGALVVRMLAKSAPERPAMGEVAAKLRSFCKSAPLPSSAPLHVDTARMSDKARLWIGVMGLINVALLVSLWHAMSPQKGREAGPATKSGLPASPSPSVGSPSAVVAPPAVATTPAVVTPPTVIAPSPPAGPIDSPPVVAAPTAAARAAPPPAAPPQKRAGMAPVRNAVAPRGREPSKPAVIPEPSARKPLSVEAAPPPAAAEPPVAPSQPAPVLTRPKVEYWQ